jgi:hypothetical protein
LLMPVVPIAKGRKGQRPVQPPPAEPFAMMAAAAMHQAGRLAPEAEALPPQLGGKEPA